MPSDRVAFLSRDEVLATHSTLLESAVYRPRTGHYANLAEMAAALFESLIMPPSSTGTNASRSLRQTCFCA